MREFFLEAWLVRSSKIDFQSIGARNMLNVSWCMLILLDTPRNRGRGMPPIGVCVKDFQKKFQYFRKETAWTSITNIETKNKIPAYVVTRPGDRARSRKSSFPTAHRELIASSCRTLLMIPISSVSTCRCGQSPLDDTSALYRMMYL